MCTCVTLVEPLCRIGLIRHEAGNSLSFCTDIYIVDCMGLDPDACSGQSTTAHQLTRAHRNSARELDIGRAHITPLLKVVHEQPANQQSRYQPMAATKSRCPCGERACTRLKGKRATTHVFVCCNHQLYLIKIEW